MIPETPQTLGDPELESEWITSLLLSGLFLPPDYTNLRINMASLQFLDVTGELDLYLGLLQKEIVDKFGLLKDKPLEQYYYGTNDSLYTAMILIDQEVASLTGLYDLAVKEQFMQQAEKISSAAETLRYEDLGEAIRTSVLDTEQLHRLDQTHLQLRKMQGLTAAILRAYGTAGFKLPKKSKLTVGTNSQYKLFLQNISTNIGDIASNIQLGMTLGKALDSIFSLIPKPDNLDPYVEDVCNNFLEVITDPKSFYTKCKTDQIISPTVGQLFGHCYPQFYDKFQDMFLDDLDDLDYQEVLDFRKCLGMEPDDSELSALCSQYITLGFKHA